MDEGPSTKRRKTEVTNSQLTVTAFFRSTGDQSTSSSTDKEVALIEDIPQHTKEHSPELFPSPSESATVMATATDSCPLSETTTSSRDRSTTRSLTPQSDSTPEPDLPPWSGSALNEICFGPSAYPILPPLLSSITHSVLFCPRLKPGALPRPYPDKFKDVWDGHHVRMPCSSKSMYPVDGKGLVSRWELIKEALGRPIRNSHDFEQALLLYNSHYAKRWSFRGLHCYFDEICSEEESSMFFCVLLPKIISLALSLPDIVTHAVPLLKKQQNYAITLSQQQIACLLANAFLCTFPRRNTVQRTSEYASYPFINFNSLFTANAKNTITCDRENKFRCLFHYFTRVTAKMPQGVMTFQRQVLSDPPQWERSSASLTRLHITSEGNIEDNGHGMLQVDFANKYLGGGVLARGCVQEEIRFLICPELIASLLFTEELDANECLIITGCERFSNYTGYARSFQWSGPHTDQTTRDSWGRIHTQLVAIDALKFHSTAAQYKSDNICRELNKAFCGYTDRNYPTSSGQSMAVATGNWGCGAFGGDPRLKSVLQLMAAAETKRDVVYFTFGDRKLQQDIASIHSLFTRNRITVGQIWGALVSYSTYRTRRDRPSLYSFLHTTLGAAVTPSWSRVVTTSDDSAENKPPDESEMERLPL